MKSGSERHSTPPLRSNFLPGGGLTAMAIGHSKPINVDKYEIGDWGGRGKEEKRGRNEKETNREEAE